MKSNNNHCNVIPILPITLVATLWLLLPIVLYGQLNWIYTYNGIGNNDDVATSIACGTDDRLYATGYTRSNIAYDDNILILCLNTTTGDTIWTHIYCGTTDGYDRGNKIIYDPSGNIYVAGYMMNSGTGYDLTVFSIDTSGVTNWIYSYSDQGSSYANTIVMKDNKIYVGGQSDGNNFAVFCLTTSGDTDWVYRNPGSYASVSSITCDDYGNVYAAGTIDYEYVVIEIDSTGTMVSSFSEYAWGQCTATSICYGNDDNIYAVGYLTMWYGNSNMLIASFSTTGDTNWTYLWDGPGGPEIDWDEAYDVIYGDDNRIYAAGRSSDNANWDNFAVWCFDTLGQNLWVYVRDFFGYADIAGPLDYASTGQLCVGGSASHPTTFNRDLAVVRLTNNSPLWSYIYSGTGNGHDGAQDVVFGDDGNIYVAGYCTNLNTEEDFTIISLGPQGGICERSTNQAAFDNKIDIHPNPIRNLVTISFSQYSVHTAGSLSIVDVNGQIRDVIWDGRILPQRLVYQFSDTLPSGIYYFVLRLMGQTFVKKAVLAR